MLGSGLACYRRGVGEGMPWVAGEDLGWKGQRVGGGGGGALVRGVMGRKFSGVNVSHAAGEMETLGVNRVFRLGTWGLCIVSLDQGRGQDFKLRVSIVGYPTVDRAILRYRFLSPLLDLPANLPANLEPFGLFWTIPCMFQG